MSSNTRICVSLCAKNLEELKGQISRAEKVADVIELRLDCLDHLQIETTHQQVTNLISHLSNPVIITFRPIEQGGLRPISFEERRAFWNGAIGIENAFFDLEADLCRDRQSLGSVDWSRVICSHHDFQRVPRNLQQLYEGLAKTAAGVLKIAVHANDATECLPLFELLDRAKQEGRQLIVVAMGDAGVFTRVLGPSRGSFLTYCALGRASGTAPGQLTAQEMKQLYRVDSISSNTAIYGVVGSPVSHSISPHLHNAAFAANENDAVYLPFEVKDLRSFIKRMVHPTSRELPWPLMGLSVTAPHKLEVMQYLDSIDPQAGEIGAVNTVVVEGNKLRGHNTDADGFIGPLMKAFELKHATRVAVIGAGGAANAAIWSLKQKGIQPVIFARDLAKARSVADRFDVSCEQLEGAQFDSFDVVVNTTPLGSAGRLINETVAMAEQLCGVRLVYDLVYNPLETRLMREAKDASCAVLGGLEMLIAQAALQFKLWTGKDAQESVMREAAFRALQTNPWIPELPRSANRW